jgi:hypothetical protein
MTANVHFLKGLAVACWLWLLASCNAGDTVLYSDDFRDHYPTSGQRFEMSRYQLEAPAVVWDYNHQRKITTLRTRGDKYGYEEQKCVITIEGEGIKRPRFLSILGFRNVETSWITGKLVLLKLDIGHVAGVEAVYDAERDNFVYCESVSYVLGIEPDGPANGSQPSRSETKQTSSATGSRR